MNVGYDYECAIVIVPTVPLAAVEKKKALNIIKNVPISKVRSKGSGLSYKAHIAPAFTECEHQSAQFLGTLVEWGAKIASHLLTC